MYVDAYLLDEHAAHIQREWAMTRRARLVRRARRTEPAADSRCRSSSA